jgi:hypothetical protein
MMVAMIIITWKRWRRWPMGQSAATTTGLLRGKDRSGSGSGLDRQGPINRWRGGREERQNRDEVSHW